MSREKTKGKRGGSTTTVMLGRGTKEIIVSLGTNGEPMDTTLRRLLGLGAGVLRGPSSSDKLAVKLSREVRAHIKRYALKGETVESTLRRLIGHGGVA